MAELRLKCGTTVLMDDEDLPRFAGLAWYIDRKGYVARKTNVDKKPGRTVFMHRQVIGAVPGQLVDHVNGNPQDNRSANLRIATLQENGRNMRKRGGVSSQFKGVTWSKSCGKWQAQIKIVNSKNAKYLGVFECEHEAGHAYNKAAVEYFGEFACLNPVGHSKD